MKTFLSLLTDIFEILCLAAFITAIMILAIYIH
jgi:hypothetical protein